MSNPVIDELIAATDKAEGVMESAVTFIQGEAARIQAAVDAALANGATEEQLAPIVDEIQQLNEKADALAAAIASNPGTPEEPPVE